MLCFELHGHQIRISFGFFFLICIVSMFNEIDFVLKLYFALTLHELGHIAAIKICGGKISKIVFSAIGINIKAQLYGDINNSKRLFVAAAGPLANAAAFFVFAPYNSDISKICIAIALYSLIPLEGFDGGDILDIFINVTDYIKTAVFIIYTVAFIAILSVSNMLNFSVIVIILYIVLLSLISDESV